MVNLIGDEWRYVGGDDWSGVELTRYKAVELTGAEFSSIKWNKLDRS